RLEPALARDRRPRATLRAVRQVEILERLLRLGRADPRLQLRCQLLLLRDRLQDRRAALLQLAQVLRAVPHFAALELVEAARRLLAVARDERQCVAVVEEGERRRHLARGDRQLVGDLLDQVLRQHGFGGSLWASRPRGTEPRRGRRARTRKSERVAALVQPA